MSIHDAKPLDGYRKHSLERRAMDLLAHLETTEGASLRECVETLGWTRGEVRSALLYARETVCPKLGLTVPHPVPDDGFRYRVTGQWLSVDGRPAIAAGTSYALGQIEARLVSLRRDVSVAKANLDPRSIPGRKVNYLDKHLARIVDVLDDIGSSVPPPSQAQSA